MNEQLKPCPFCGAGETIVEPDSKAWTGTKWSGLSYQVLHWCKESEGVIGSMIVKRSRTKQGAIDKWNSRV